MNFNLHDLYIRSASFYRLKAANRRIYLSIKRGDKELKFGPSSINLMMADVCNSQCIMCGNDYRTCGSGETLTLDKIKVIYNNLRKSQIVEVIYGGGGEPFLNLELSDIAAFTKTRFPYMQHTVISNFLNVKKSIIEKLIKFRVNFLISINAATAETFKEISGQDSFDRVCDNIKSLIEIRKSQKSTAGVSISIILMRQNFKELSLLIQLARNLGVEKVKTMYVRVYPERYRKKGDGNILLFPDDSLYFHKKESNREIIKAIELSKKLGITFEHSPLFGSHCGVERNCKEPWRSLFINYNGDLFPCAAGEIMFMDKVASKKYDSGNILEQPIKEIWNNPFWKALRETNTKVNRRKKIIPECKCCGMAIDWLGPDVKEGHIMDWEGAEKSPLSI